VDQENHPQVVIEETKAKGEKAAHRKRECSGRTSDFNFFVKNGLAEFLKPSRWLRTTYEAPYQRYE